MSHHQQPEDKNIYLPPQLSTHLSTRYLAPPNTTAIYAANMTKRKQSDMQSASLSSSNSLTSSYSSNSALDGEEQSEQKVQIIICSCSTHLAPGTIHINPSPLSCSTHPVYTLKQLSLHTLALPRPSELISAFTPSPISSFVNTHAAPYLVLLAPHIPPNLPLALSQLRDLNLPARAKKYIRNPLLGFRLANRTRVGVQSIGVMSFRLCFNIFVVIAWLLIRRFAEIFGIKLRPLSIKSENISACNDQEEEEESTVAVAREGAGWNEVQERGRERERARRKREAWVEVEAE